MSVMTVRTNSRGPLRVSFLCCFGVLALGLSCRQPAAAEDDYLSAISTEAKKVESTELSGIIEEAGDSKSAERAVQGEQDAPRNKFETDLKERYRGSYTFYQKLPGNSRDEIYQSYLDGASISEIRKRIIERFLKK